jgi:carbonic anhydrase
VDLIYRFDPFRPASLNKPSDAEAALRTLLEGNLRLVRMIEKMQQATLDGDVAGAPMIVPVDLLSMGLPLWSGAALAQAPFALVLGCSDARVPIESVFDQSFNDLFVVRIAGNVLGTECLGSFDFAVRNLGESLRAVVVLGHTGCGAVTAAVDTYLSPKDYADIAFSHALRSIVDRVLIAVRGAASAFERRCGAKVQPQVGYRAALIDAAVYLNAAITAYDLKREKSNAEATPLEVFYGACDVKSMCVRALPARDPHEPPRLCPAPSSAEELIGLADRVVEIIVETEGRDG